MRPSLLLVAILLLFGLAEKTFAQTAVVRGRLVRMGYPIPNVRVNLYNDRLGFSGTVFSGEDGMYYLNSIPYGIYYLQVWANLANPAVPLSYPLQVSWPVTDVPIITLP